MMFNIIVIRITLERLETLKGPTAMIFGRGGGGGVINRVTKEANSNALREITLTGGSYYNRGLREISISLLMIKLLFV